MKTILLSILFLLAGKGAFAKTGNMGIGAATPNAATKFDVASNSGATTKLFTTNTKGIIVNTAVAINNCGTSTFHTNHAACLAAAIQFLGSAVFTLSLTITPVPESAVTTTEGFVNKLNPAAFEFPVGLVSAHRSITASGARTLATSVNSSNVTTFYKAALPTKAITTSTNRLGERARSAIAAVKVTKQDEPVWLPGVPFSLKVFLEGPLADGTTMNALLQNYYGGNTGLLPETSPYGAPTNTYADINNDVGPAGIVVDWVVVEVRLAGNYGVIAESQSLLLKADGSIVTPTGAVPVFATQTGIVRVVIKHRNHLAIMSKDITNFNSAISYDFTTALSKAANDFADPAQMKIAYGVWMMIAGDVNMDNAIETLDQNIIWSAFLRRDVDDYLNTDTDLNSEVVQDDVDILRENFLTGYYSTLTNY